MRTTSYFLPGIFTDQQRQQLMTGLPDLWKFIAHKRTGLLECYPMLYICSANVTIPDDPCVVFSLASGIPLYSVGRATSSRRINNTKPRVWTFCIVNRIDVYSESRYVQYTDLSVLLRSISPESRTKQGNLIPAGRNHSELNNTRSRHNGIYRYISQEMLSAYAKNLINNLDTTDWMLTREQQITLMAAHLNKIKSEDVPDTVTAAITQAYAQLQRSTDSKTTINKDCHEMFNREKWIILYVNEPVKYYIVGKCNAEWMYKVALTKASNSNISVDIKPPDDLIAVKSLSNLPDSIRDDVNGAVAMYIMGRGNCATVDPDKLIPNEPCTYQDLGACSYGKGYSVSGGMLVLDV